MPILTPPISSRNGNGTASACRPVSGRDARGHMRGAALFAQRRGHHQKLSGSAAVTASSRRHRRRIAGGARRPGAELQRAAAAAEPQSGLAKTDKGLSDPSARLRSARRGRHRPAHAAVCRAPRAARGFCGKARRCEGRSVADDCLRQLGRADVGAEKSGQRRRRRGCRSRRGRDAEAPRCALSAGPPEGPMVEMEARSAHHRCRADVCAARPRQALVLLFGLYVRGLDRRRGWRAAGAGRQGLFRLHRRGAAADRPLRPPQHHREIRPRAACGARAGPGAGAGSRLRGPATLARGTNPAWRCGFRASTGCAGTSRRARPTGWKRWSGC